MSNSNFAVFTIDKENSQVIVNIGNAMIPLSFGLLETIQNAVDKEIYYRQDIINEINDRMESGELPPEAGEDSDFVSHLLNEYTALMEENKGLADGLDWRQCINEAFNMVSYSDYEEDMERE